MHKKILNNKKIKKLLLIIPILFAVLFLALFIIPVKDGRSYVAYISYSKKLAGAIEPNNYDKMKISFVNVKERTTGTPSFSSGDESDMNGHDVSPTDNYVRTRDSITYMLEVGIEKNENTTSPTDTFKGGIIKVKATIPESDDGNIYISFGKDAWMKDYKYNSNYTEITAYYYIPDDKTAIGGTQQLSFTVRTSLGKKQLTSDYTPIFEVWMEGNKPDNAESAVDSKSTQDPNPLYITGETKASLSLASGKINNIGEVNGTKGQFINFFARAFTNTNKGYATPVNHLSSDIKIEYSYRNINENTGWIKLSEVDGVDALNNTTLYAYGRSFEPVDGYWPDSSYNVPRDTGSNYRAAYQYTWSDTDWEEWDSGTINASLTDDTINFTSDDFYFYGNYAGTLVSTGFELFVPWYEPTTGYYEYQIKVIDNSLTVEDSEGTEYTTNPNSTLTFTFRNDLSGNVQYSFSAFDYHNNLDGNGSIYQSDFSENKSIPLGRTRFYYGSASIEDGPYEGGMKRLFAWNSSYVEKIRDTTLSYSNSGIMPTPNKNDAIIKYGIYKNNQSGGLTTDALVNAAVFDDFDWYDTEAEAKEHGKLTAISVDEPEWRGYKVQSEFRLYLKPIDSITAVGKTGIIRQKIYVYADEDRTNVFSIGDGIDYTPSILNSDMTGNSVTGTPSGIGETFFITGLTLDVSTTNTDKDGPNRKTNYNIEEEIVNMSITPSFSSGIELTEGTASFKIKASIPNDLRYLENSSNYPPTTITDNDYNNTNTIIEWEFTDWDLTQPLPVITYQMEISPYSTNNSSKTIYAYISTPTSPGQRSSSTGFTLTNLAGSSVRKKFDNRFLDKDEEFTITDYVYNISQARLLETKTFEVLPRNNDDKGSSFHGNYTIKINSIAEGQQLFYTTVDPDSLEYGIDSLGNKHIQAIDIANDSRFIELNVNDIVPATATMLLSYFPEIPQVTDRDFSYTIIPNGNQIGDIYRFQMNSSSSNLDTAIHSEVVEAHVSQRKISGIAFEDVNRNNLYNENEDNLLNNISVHAVLEDGREFDTTTNSDGYYEFLLDGPHTYTITFTNKDGYEIIPAGTQDNANKANSNAQIVVTHTGNLNAEVVEKPNQNFGIRKKAATLTVKHYKVNTTTPLSDTVTSEVYYTNGYETHPATDIPNTYIQVSTSGAPTNGTVNSDNIEVIYYYDFKPATVTARHYVDGTTTKIHVDVVQNKKYTDPYETTRLDTTNLDYEYVRRDGDSETGTVERDTYVVNYYYKLKQGTVITHHYLYDGTETTTKLAPDVSKTWNYTETYTTQVSSEVPNNYELFRKSDNFAAIMNSPLVEVNYYYQLKDSNLDTTISKTGDTEITDKNAEVHYTITYNATLSDYIGDGTITIVDNLPYEIDLDNSDIANGTYNAQDKTITWTEEWNNIDTYSETNETATKEIVKNLTLVYVGIVGRDRIMTNTTAGHIELSNNSRDIEAQTSTDIKISGHIKVVYIDIDTEEELFDSIEETDLVGETFISEEKEKEGYKLVNKPDTTEHTFEEEDQLIKYEYEHLKYDIKGVVLGEGGKITGDENIFYGDDSTEDNIIITADDGYVIDTITINGEETDIGRGESLIILNNFINVTEDKKIEVTFMKKPPKNPNTKSFMSLKVTYIILVVLFSLYYNFNKSKKKRYSK